MNHKATITTESVHVVSDLQEICFDVLQEKYAKGEEKTLPGPEMAKAIRLRVAKALAAEEKDAKKYQDIFMRAMESGFIPGGRVNSSAGTGIKNVTLINCFVQPIGDSISDTVDGKEGIYPALRDAAETMRRGGGVGYDFSSIRPSGAQVKGTASSASGPVSYMHVFDQSCSTVESAGARRGAQMGVLRVDHPDIMKFVTAKQQSGRLNNFNISVAITDSFMQSLEAGSKFELVHKAEPSDELIEQGAYQREEDGKWVYRVVDPAEIWSGIMDSTYNAAEPGVLFIDRINIENNLHYCEVIEATNPCGEIPIPDFGCCCLGSINLTAFINNPFSKNATFNYETFAWVVTQAVRMLDDVLNATAWPLPQQQQEAINKRRIGLGYTGLGDALIEMGIRYDSEPGRVFGGEITRFMRDTAYRASIELAKEKGPFPQFDAVQYLESGFAKRLPDEIKEAIREHGIRNSHLLSIAPTGTISLAFADNTSNGIEPAFSWFYNRTKRMADGSTRDYKVEDHAYRVWGAIGNDQSNLPECFVSALDISARDHMLMQAAIQPFIDASISKTVNVPGDYPFAQFADLYLEAWKAGLKGITTYRPNSILGSVLSVETPVPQDLDQSEPDRKIRINETPEVALASLRWTNRPKLSAGNPGVTFMVESYESRFALFIGHIENGTQHPFEVWVNGAEQPRGLTALAKNLSMDMRSEDHDWLKIKLDSLSKTAGSPFSMAMPPVGDEMHVPGNVAAMAHLIRYRCDELGLFTDTQRKTPLTDAMFSRKEPKSGTNGTLSWTVDIHNPTTGDDFAMFVKECVMPDGSHRPYSVWLSGTYPLDFNGITKSLSLDMRVLDTAWIGKKLRSLKDLPEAQGDFFAKTPGSDKQEIQPSTIAYIARLLIHRYHMLGILDEKGFPLHPMGMLQAEVEPAKKGKVGNITIAGKVCPECGVSAVIRRDGCDFCSACGHTGSCG
ncbi:adenosylcobalamin-dependent ribonucleoside-diphosphate reductase [Neptunomonas qingdaonensis]|uniref:Vitamin B12-dependent ribonucleotide reductase n=1 Tax=Neptunomonas qingdaonensis TaxID=1045558 RepID=A0A1I2RIC7_9GAMM|nr:adenosylcobalamin-dependent ribonucleoside-diphosphate reductase [Neptunomonas qingdaonensis]SFG37611.1 ribonucleoside-diphosphate reductase class II [Neptunomonas qingdaonensis]